MLPDFYDRVTLSELDELPSTPANRTAIPPGRHVRLPIARNAVECDALLPDRIHSGAAGHLLAIGPALREEFTSYVPSRSHLEWQIQSADVLVVPSGGWVVRPIPRCRGDRSRSG